MVVVYWVSHIIIILLVTNSGNDCENVTAQMGTSYVSFFIVLALLLACSADFTCPAGEYPVQKADVEIESNGCSKPKFIQVGGEEDFTYCCDRHDACYASCSAPKVFCDKDFRKCMNSLCRTNFKHNQACPSAAVS